jgi:hypothetical protein
MITPYFTNISLDRCFLFRYQCITYLFSSIRENHLKKASAVFGYRECSTSTRGEANPLKSSLSSCTFFLGKCLSSQWVGKAFLHQKIPLIVFLVGNFLLSTKINILNHVAFPERC